MHSMVGLQYCNIAPVSDADEEAVPTNAQFAMPNAQRP